MARLAAPRSRVSVLYTLHGSLWGPGVPALRRTCFTGLERALASRTDRVFTVNPDDARDCVERAGYAERRVTTLPAGGAGVAPEFFAAAEEPDAGRRARRELGVSEDAPTVGYVGRTVVAKGVSVLARAFRRLHEREPAARLVVIGDALEGDRGAYSAHRFRREAGPAGDAVRWVGFSDRVARLIPALDLVALPSLREGFGMSLAEAAAVGRPGVASDTRGARAVIAPGVTGLIVPIGDAEALAGALERLIRDAETAARMGAAARRRARERFTRRAVLDAYLEEYESVRRARPAGLRS